MVEVGNNYKQFVQARALLDTGASCTVVSLSLVNALRLHRYPNYSPIKGVGNNTVNTSLGIVKLLIRPIHTHSPVLYTQAIVLSELTSQIPSHTSKCSLFNTQQFNFKLADSTYNVPSPVDLIIGTDLLNYVYDGTKLNINSQLSAYNTIFGYVIMGPSTSTHTTKPMINVTQFNGVTLTEAIERFWKTEELPKSILKNPQHLECEHLFSSTITKCPDGKFMVRLPLRHDRPHLGDSRSSAYNRFMSLERKMTSNTQFRLKYKEFMNEYINMGHMSPSQFDFSSEHYVIPHHGVFKKGSDKIRVVFDGSCKTTSGVSLNQCLYSGEPLHNDVSHIILNFRTHKYVFTADIKMMFRCTWIHPDDRKYQLIFWRDKPTDRVQLYELNTNTYGLTSSPFISIRTLHHLANCNEAIYPHASQVLLHDIFVDDILTGGHSLQQTKQLQYDLITLLKAAGYELRKWSSNTPQLLEGFPSDHCETPHQFDTQDDQSFIKVLGIQWDPNSDSFSYKTIMPSDKAITKRTILSTIARLFDPCGFVNPVILRFKLILQLLFLSGTNWDDPVTTEIGNLFQSYMKDLNALQSIHIPRHVISELAVQFSLHGFGDASEKAYASAVYLRVEDSNGKAMVKLLFAKSKVSPIKKRQTIPKLELSAAHLTAKLLNHVILAYQRKFTFSTIIGWSDSTIVLTWLKTQPHRLQVFEGNRVNDINSSAHNIIWCYVPSELNPADCASRGLSAADLIRHELWWSPPWLSHPSSEWPTARFQRPTDLPGLKNLIVAHVQPKFDLFSSLFVKFSSYSKLINVMSFILRFINNMKIPQSQQLLTPHITLSEMRNANHILIKHIQSLSFEREISLLKAGKPIFNSLRKLSLFIDAKGLLRVGGRLRHSNLKFNTKHPILLPKDHIFVKLLVSHYHTSHCHVGANTLISILRQEYWILSVRRLASTITFKCISCYRVKANSKPPYMADLPLDRVSQARPFAGTATDFAGPFLVKSSLLRNAKSVKAYLCVFVCLSTKAVHLEVVSSLSLEAFIAAFSRFVSRRGLPSLMRSDNGTNFVGANKHLKELNDFLIQNQYTLADSLKRRNITWLFNPPSAPHMGGLFEAAVRSAKTHLNRTIGNQILTYEELSTVFCKIEAVLNSRPLAATSNDPNDLEMLTPGHFLIGQPLAALPEHPWKDTKLNKLSRFQLLQSITQHFWNRWHTEYLSTLQARNKWTQHSEALNLNDLVLIKEEHSPSLHWKRGRVIKLLPGKDGVIRSVELKTQTGILMRPVVKLCKLPLS